MSKEILCTIGPSSLNQGVLTRMNELAVTLLRINMSHTSTYDLPDTIRFIQEFSNKPICIDTEGAQIRTGKMAEGSITLSEGSFLEIPRKKISAEGIDRKNWPNDYCKIIYIDHFGNAITGLRAKSLLEKEILEVGEQKFYRSKTFSDVAPGTAFWYENSIGLAEISVNQGRADQLGLKIGTNVTISKNKSKY